jgi:hypothetical protein
MDYLKHYNLLIESRKDLNRSKEKGYFESHHIVPKCYGGTDVEDNLILLSAREHFVAHWLLWRANRDKKSSSMFNAMTRFSKGQKRYYSSRGYQEARESLGITKKGIPLSEEHKAKIKKNNARTGKPNWNSGKKWTKKKVQCSECGEYTSEDMNRRSHGKNCQLEEYKLLLKLHTRKEILILKNITNPRLQYWVNKIRKLDGTNCP